MGASAMNIESRPPDLACELDKLEDAIAQALKATGHIFGLDIVDALPARERFRLLHTLFDWQHLAPSPDNGLTKPYHYELIGAKSDTLSQRIEASITSNGGLEAVQVARKAINDLIFNVLGLDPPTYIVFSYWSPIDDKRHSTIMRRTDTLENSERPKALAYALWFFGMTLLLEKSNAEQTLSFTSMIQFIAKRANRKVGVHASFSPRGRSEVGQAQISIPDDLWTRPFADLVGKHIEDWISQTPLSLDTLDARFGTLVANTEQLDVGQLVPAEATTFLQDFESAYNAYNFESNPDLGLEDITHTLNSLWMGPELEKSECCFMLLTHLMWRQACPCSYIYTFPVAVGDSCCVMTFGTDEPLLEMQKLALATLAQGLYGNALLYDYAALERQRKELSVVNMFRRLMGHNLPKFMITPSMTELASIKERLSLLLENSDSQISRMSDNRSQIDEREALTLMCRSVERMQLLFRHYDTFLAALMKSETYREQFSRATEVFDLARLVRHELPEIFKIACTRIVDEWTYGNMRLVLNMPKRCIIEGHQTFVTEILWNLVSNAVEAIDPRAAMSCQNPQQWTIDVTVEPYPNTHDAALLISVQNYGVAFGQERKHELSSVFDELSECNSETLWNAIGRIFAERVKNASEGRLGIGLTYAVAYLASLRVNRGSSWIGGLEVTNDSGSPSEIILRLPGLRTLDGTQRQDEFRPDPLPTEWVLPQVKERVFVFSSRDECYHLFADTLDPYKYDISSHAYSRNTLEDELAACPSLIIVDIGEMPDDFVTAVTNGEDPNSVPDCLEAFTVISRAIIDKGLNRTILIACCQRRHKEFVQEELEADWLCFDLESLRSLQSAIEEHRCVVPIDGPETLRERGVLVVENSREICHSLRARFGNRNRFVFVAADCPASHIAISSDDVKQAFLRAVWHGGIDVAIVDLALSDKEEEFATKLLAVEGSPSDVAPEGISAMDYEALKHLARDIAARTNNSSGHVNLDFVFKGLTAILALRGLHPQLPILIFSNYVHRSEWVSIVKDVLASHRIRGIEVLSKEEINYDKLPHFINTGKLASEMKEVM
jgi:hypothetical protein